MKHKREPWAGRRGFKGYDGEYLKNRKQTLKEEPTCRLCGNPSTTVDHIISKADGGTHARSNLRGLCKDCHDARSKMQAIEGRKHRG